MPPRVRSKGAAASAKTGFWSSWKLGLIGLGAVVVALSFVLPGVLGSKSPSEAAIAKKAGVPVGDGLPAGMSVPAFAGTNLLNGEQISSKTVYDKKTLLFFSEGVMCQACFEQIQGLQKFGASLAKRGIQLVSITPDTPGDLEQAARGYGITTPLISDESRSISEAFNTLGKGMHSNTPGHAFALLYRGKVLWYRDYYLPPSNTRYVPPQKLLAQIPNA